MVEELDGEKTAFCHFCPVDVLLGNAAGLPISDEEFVQQFCSDWFAGEVVKLKTID